MNRIIVILTLLALFGCKTKEQLKSSTYFVEITDTLVPTPVFIRADSVQADFNLTIKDNKVVPTKISVVGSKIELDINVAASGAVIVKAKQPERTDTIMRRERKELIITDSDKTTVVTKTKASAITRLLSRVGIAAIVLLVLYVIYRIYKPKFKLI